MSELQLAVKGSAAPSAWHPADFVAAVRLLRVDAVLYRDDCGAQWIGVDDLPDGRRRRLYLELAEDGSHVEAVARVSVERTPYVSVGTDGDAWRPRVPVLSASA